MTLLCFHRIYPCKKTLLDYTNLITLLCFHRIYPCKKTLLDYTSLFSSNDYQKNKKKIYKCCSDGKTKQYKRKVFSEPLHDFKHKTL